MRSIGEGLFSHGLGGLVSGDSGDPGGLANSVVRHIELSLTVGLLHDGEKLPPEARLADQLGVSTITLRQALATLRDRGIIETRRGRSGGSYIRDSQSVNATQAERTLRAMSSDELRDLGDLFSAVVSRSAWLGAFRASPSETHRLHRILTALEAADHANSRRRAYCRLHIEIAVAAQSPRLAQATTQLLGEIAAPLWNSQVSVLAVDTVGYGSLLAAIERRDAASARDTAHRLVESESRALIEQHLRLMSAPSTEVAW